MTNSTLWDNASTVCNECPDWYSQIASADEDFLVDFEISYSCVDASAAPSGTGNITDDPMFLDTTSGDLRLGWSSPAVDAGEESIRPEDVEDVNEADGSSEPHPKDLVDNERLRGAELDMGAYERLPCQGDLNDDGVIDGDDLGTLLGTWGNCPDQMSRSSEPGMTPSDLMEILAVESIEDLVTALMEMDAETRDAYLALLM